MHVASWRTAYRGFVPDAYLDTLTTAARAADWRARFASPGLEVLLADAAGTLAAFCAHGPSHDADADASVVWEIHSLHVRPERTGTGIGGRLFAEAAARGAAAGRAVLTLWVVDPNRPARAFYERRGMTPDGARQSRIIAPGVVLHEVRYRMPLARG